MTSEAARALAAAMLLAVATAAAGCRGDAPTARPNVLVVCIDALRADRLGVYGASPSPSPSLDALARDAVVFENATSVASWTKPSVPSLLTGLYPQEHGVFDNSGDHVDSLGGDAVPLAAMLTASGYRTAAFVENDQLLRHLSGLDKGFSLYFDQAGRPPEIVDRFLTWSAQDDAAPWFAYLHFLDPHFPYTPDDFTLPAGDAERLRVRTRHWDLRGELWWLLRQRVNEGSMRLDEQALADLDLLYRLEITAVDAAIGRMLSQLDVGGVLDRTLVVVTADHGEGFLEHGRLDHGYGPYQELLHVPLLLRLPGHEHGGTRSRALVQNVDVAATVLARAGLPAPPAWSSVSLLPALEGHDKEVREFALAQERHGHWQLLAVRDQRFSYIRSEGATTPPRPRALVPASAVAGTRVRARGIFDGSRLVAGSVKHLAPGDPDTELEGPVDSIDAAALTMRVLGVSVRVGDGVPEEGADSRDAKLTVANARRGEMLRVHGAVRDGLFAPTKVERLGEHSIGIEGVVRGIEVLADGDAVIDLGDVSLLVDPRAEWNDFPDDDAAKPPRAAAAKADSRTTEELFDREADPREQHDVAAVHPSELARLRALADRATGALQARTAGEPQRATLDSETRERLRALGYVE